MHTKDVVKTEIVCCMGQVNEQNKPLTIGIRTQSFGNVTINLTGETVSNPRNKVSKYNATSACMNKTCDMMS
jgi:hypothetical protein